MSPANISENQVDFDLLVSRISEVTREKLINEQSHARNRIAVFMTAGLTIFVAALTGVATFGLSTLKENIVETTQARIDRNVPQAIVGYLESELPSLREDILTDASRELTKIVEKEASEAKRAWEVITKRADLISRVERISGSESFSNAEIAEVIRLLGEVSVDSVFRETQAFSDVLEKIVDACAAADRIDLVRELQNRYEDEMLDSSGIAFTMSLSLGREVIGFSNSPSGLGSGQLMSEWRALIDEYRVWSDAARESNLPEIPYLFDLILSCQLDEPRSVMRTYLGRVDDMDVGEVETIIKLAIILRTQEWRRNPDAFSDRVASSTQFCASKLPIDSLSERQSAVIHAMMAE